MELTAKFTPFLEDLFFSLKCFSSSQHYYHSSGMPYLLDTYTTFQDLVKLNSSCLLLQYNECSLLIIHEWARPGVQPVLKPHIQYLDAEEYCRCLQENVTSRFHLLIHQCLMMNSALWTSSVSFHEWCILHVVGLKAGHFRRSHDWSATESTSDATWRVP